MRVTNSMLGGQLLLSLQRVLGKLAKQQDQIASGRRILAPSDDPAGIAQSLTVKSRRTINDQHQRNITEARSILQTTDGHLQSIVESITQVREIAVRGGNDTNGPQERQAIGAQVNQFLETLVERHRLVRHVTKMEPDSLGPQPDYAEVVVTIELHDVSLRQLVDFLSDVETSESIVRVGTLHIRKDPNHEALLDSTVGIHSPKPGNPALASGAAP